MTCITVSEVVVFPNYFSYTHHPVCYTQLRFMYSLLSFSRLPLLIVWFLFQLISIVSKVVSNMKDFNALFQMVCFYASARLFHYLRTALSLLSMWLFHSFRATLSLFPRDSFTLSARLFHSICVALSLQLFGSFTFFAQLFCFHWLLK